MGTVPVVACPGGTYPKEAGEGGMDFDFRRYAMVCDRRFQVMRFALPWEEDDGYFSIFFLGRQCHPPSEKE
jgi:hypothetical protein